MGRGFSEEEINELKEQFELFDMMGDGECVWHCFLVWLLWNRTTSVERKPLPDDSPN
jgi:hypothetical protein